MNDLSRKLHSAARRYCHEQFILWANRYSELDRRGLNRTEEGYYTEEAYMVFPRCNVLQAIRRALEKLTDTHFASLEEARQTFITVGELAKSDFTKPNGPIDASAMEEERIKFAEYMKGLSETELATVEELPYRRVLRNEEVASWRAQLKEVWRVGDGYWFPLDEKPDKQVEAFQDKHLREAIPDEKFREILKAKGVDRLFEIREYDESFEIDMELFEPVYNGAEGYWCSQNMDWIVYASHESSITIGGWMLNEISECWSAWREHLWTSPYFK